MKDAIRFLFYLKDIYGKKTFMLEHYKNIFPLANILLTIDLNRNCSSLCGIKNESFSVELKFSKFSFSETARSNNDCLKSEYSSQSIKGEFHLPVNSTGKTDMVLHLMDF